MKERFLRSVVSNGFRKFWDGSELSDRDQFKSFLELAFKLYRENKGDS